MPYIRCIQGDTTGDPSIMFSMSLLDTALTTGLAQILVTKLLSVPPVTRGWDGTKAVCC